MKALIIQDETLKIELINEYFKGNFTTVIHVKTMTEALPLLRENDFDYIFLDHHLPDCKGTEFVVHIKIMQPSAKCISISNDFDIIQLYDDLGYDDVFYYPFDLCLDRILEENSSLCAVLS